MFAVIGQNTFPAFFFLPIKGFILTAENHVLALVLLGSLIVNDNVNTTV